MGGAALDQCLMALRLIHVLKLTMAPKRSQIPDFVGTVGRPQMGRRLTRPAVGGGTVAVKQLVNRQPILQVTHSLLQGLHRRFEIHSGFSFALVPYKGY